MQMWVGGVGQAERWRGRDGVGNAPKPRRGAKEAEGDVSVTLSHNPGFGGAALFAALRKMAPRDRLTP